MGPLAFGGHEENVFLGRDFGGGKDYSESTGNLIDAEVSRFMKNAFKMAKEVLTKHRKALDTLANKLITEETVERDEFAAFVKVHAVA